jgi:hypothetical protein
MSKLRSRFKQGDAIVAALPAAIAAEENHIVKRYTLALYGQFQTHADMFDPKILIGRCTGAIRRVAVLGFGKTGDRRSAQRVYMFAFAVCQRARGMQQIKVE